MALDVANVARVAQAAIQECHIWLSLAHTMCTACGLGVLQRLVPETNEEVSPQEDQTGPAKQTEQVEQTESPFLKDLILEIYKYLL
jgi:hypothetical protein